jgi:hypothetical protein
MNPWGKRANFLTLWKEAKIKRRWNVLRQYCGFVKDGLISGRSGEGECGQAVIDQNVTYCKGWLLYAS